MEPQVTQLGFLRQNLVNPQMSVLAANNCFRDDFADERSEHSELLELGGGCVGK